MADPIPPTDTDTDPTAALSDAAAPGTDADDDGYEIHLCVYADGTYGVRGPLPLDQDQGSAGAPGGPGGPGDQDMTAGQGGSERTFDAASGAVKAIVKILQDNPVSASEQEGFESGFGPPKPGAGAPRY